MVLQTVLQVNYTNPEIIGKLAPLFGDGYTMLIFSAVVFGLGMRTVYRFYEEKKAGNPDAQVFDMKFLGTAFGAFVVAGLPAMALMPSATATFNSLLPEWGAVFSWIFTALLIYSANAGVNAAFKIVEHKTVSNYVKSGKMDKAIKERMKEISGVDNRGTENSPDTTERKDGTSGVSPTTNLESGNKS